MPRSLLVLLVVSAAACTVTSDDRVVTTPESPPDTTTTSTDEEPTITATAPLADTTATTATTVQPPVPDPANLELVSFPVPSGSRPHDVAPGINGEVWYTAQGAAALGRLDPATGETRHTHLGSGSRPHGVIVDLTGVPWITDSGLNSIVSVDPTTEAVTVFPLPADRPDANLNTATFDGAGDLWFTGQRGIYGRLDPVTGDIEVFDAPQGRGPYGITTTPEGAVYYASLAGSFVGAISEDGTTMVLEPPTPDQGARRVWSDSRGQIWVSEWNTGNLSRYMPDTGDWDSWHLPGDAPQAYAVYVDDQDLVWVSDFGSNSIVRFDPTTEVFDAFPLPHDPGEVRQLLGRPGEVWAAESAADSLVLIRERQS